MTREEFDNAVAVGPKLMVRFTASWCGPCKVYGPVFDEVLDKHPEFNTPVIDADSNKELCTSLGVRGLPTTMRFENGALYSTKVGSLTAGQLETILAG
ncbi:putative thioredoxin [Achromobacter phage vB_AxyP_19-32_Axy13]|uniref:Putative thioredoxin n=1 Tax=Achromobacter phage vB_AxyP_19-32_Axy13 TaxID=2591044 RepID=A0A514CUR7_9CAUD|nr:putative thioredoxin [Achromobacter phage vB_AxyP_19-32_Axy13]